MALADKDTSIPTPMYERMQRRWEDEQEHLLLSSTMRGHYGFDQWFWEDLDDENRENDDDVGRHVYREHLRLPPLLAKDLMEWFVHQRVVEMEKCDPGDLMDRILAQMEGKGTFVTGNTVKTDSE